MRCSSFPDAPFHISIPFGGSAPRDPTAHAGGNGPFPVPGKDTHSPFPNQIPYRGPRLGGDGGRDHGMPSGMQEGSSRRFGGLPPLNGRGRPPGRARRARVGSPHTALPAVLAYNPVSC